MTVLPNPYVKAVAVAYAIPLGIFVLIPLLLLLVLSGGQGWFVLLVTGASVTALTVMPGVLIAPIIGPKVQADKSFAFLMSFGSLGSVALFIQLFSMVRDSGSLSFMLMPLVIAYGILPAILAALFFIGQCEEIDRESA